MPLFAWTLGMPNPIESLTFNAYFAVNFTELITICLVQMSVGVVVTILFVIQLSAAGRTC